MGGEGTGWPGGGRRRPLIGLLPLEHTGPPVPLLWTGVPTSGRQEPLPMFRCPGFATTSCRVFPDHLIREATATHGSRSLSVCVFRHPGFRLPRVCCDLCLLTTVVWGYGI